MINYFINQIRPLHRASFLFSIGTLGVASAVFYRYVWRQEGGLHFFQRLQADSSGNSLSFPFLISRDRPLWNTIQKLFHERGLEFKKLENQSGLFICPDSCWSDIKEILQELSVPERNKIGVFYYNPDQRSICCDFRLQGGILYPTAEEWIDQMKASKKEAENSLFLCLTNGAFLSEDQFLKDPLFKDSLEKYSVFRRLCKFRASEGFERAYETFRRLLASNSPRWADIYRNNPKELALVSLFAYLDKRISSKELFTAHMLSSAFFESSDSAQYIVLNDQNASQVLERFSYVSKEDCLLSPLEEISSKSLLERTCVLYESTFGLDYSLYSNLSRSGQPTRGFRKGSGSACRVCLLPPWLEQELQERIAYPATPMRHKESFGYRRSLADLIWGRPISYPSVLFYLPEVHGIGNKQLGILVHDVLGHCFFDGKNPYVQNLISLGKDLRSLGSAYIPFAATVLDRAVTTEFADPKENMRVFMGLVYSNVEKFPLEQQQVFYSLCEKNLPSDVLPFKKAELERDAALECKVLF